MQLHEPVEDGVQVVQCGGPPGVPRHADGVPRVAYRRGAGVSLDRRVRRPRRDRAVVGETLAVRRRLLPGYGRTRRTAGAGRGEQRHQPSAQRPALHHHVDLPVSEQEVGGLEALRQGPPGDLADHTRAGEAHPCTTLGENQIGVGGERGGHPAVGRVGEDAHGEQPRLAQRGDGLTDGRHLHQRQRALLHPRPAGGGDQDERGTVVQRPFRRPGDQLAHRAAQAATEEAEVHHRQGHRVPTDGGRGADDPLGKTRAGPRTGEPVRVRQHVDEVERVRLRQPVGQQAQRTRVDQLAQAFRRAESGMLPALRADVEVAAQPFAVEQAGAAGAAGPELLFTRRGGRHDRRPVSGASNR
ncbi:hypothetical protein PSN01_03755 [Micromonospora saelicesensis]|nr:hypothetical protein PSN01_03755 [Micromonospora saelicesensis]